MFIPLVALISLAVSANAIVVNTFDGPGFPSCHNVSAVLYPTTVNEIQSLVKDAVSKGLPVRGGGGGHSWYDTMCSDDPRTIVIKTENVNQISDLNMSEGSVVVEAGVTFLQLSTWLHQRNASIGYTLVNWNITIAGAIAMGAHRSSLREDSLVTAGALALDIINGKGDLVHLEKSKSDDWLAASTSLGLLGIISRVKFRVFPDFKVYANQKTLSEDEVVNGDIYGLISPYATANFWWWPSLKKFHLRFYDKIDISDPGNSLQNTFSLSDFEAGAAKALLYPGVVLPSSNGLAETLFFGIWSLPNFRDKNTGLPILAWPTTGWAYDVLIGGLYPDQKPEWELDLHGKTLELAVPVTQANALFKRVRQLFDESEKAGKPMHATYRSGINIKFGKAYDDLLCQSTTTSNADWSKGVIMLDFPSFITTDGKRYNEPFYENLARVVMDEFPARPHWTKNTREIFKYGKKNLDAGHLARFKAVRAKFDPNNTFKSALSEILEV